jgi:hypothetical protein
MNTGVLALGALFSGAALLWAWKTARGRAVRRRLLECGFVPCDAERVQLALELARVAPGSPPGARRSYRIGRCFKRAGGRGVLYRCAAVDRTHAARSVDAIGGQFDVYLLGLPDPMRVARAPVTVFLTPRAQGPLRELLAALVRADPHGHELELASPTLANCFLAAFGDRPGKLDEFLPGATQEKLMRAAEAGFFVAHFGAGKLALAAIPDRADVDRQLAYLAEWA